MPCRLIAKSFGWRSATEEDSETPVLVVWHPRLGRHFTGSDAWKRAVRVSVHAHHNPESAIADALDGILTPDIRKHAGGNSALIDWAVAGDDLSSSIAGVSLPDDYPADESAFPLWPMGTVR